MFVHLHVHTEYSLLDGAARIKEVVAAARKMGMPALAITDHGSMFGIVDFYKACRQEGIRPVLGCEVYVAPRAMSDRVPHVDDHLYHLTLLAENEEGYRNLLQLVSLGYTEGFYYKPRLDKPTLARFSRGLIALSGCLAGEVAELAQAGQLDQARAAAAAYNDIFGAGNFFLELQDHGLPEQQPINRGLVEIHRALGIPLVATNDVHYVQRAHAEMQDVLLCIQTGKTVDDPNRLRFNSSEMYLKSPAEMTALFGELPAALKNTLAIAERCRVELAFNQLHLPDYPIPEGKTASSYLAELCYQGIPWRYGEMTEPVRRRLEHELKIISQMGYAAYFLIVWDFIHYARAQGIPVGPGRGSAAGSLVAYLLGITNLDPLKYGLLFERFLNPDRVSMPDVDVDLCFERRGEVISYVARRYGADRVAQVATFGTMMARAAIRDVGRVLNLPYAEVDRVAKLVPAELHITIERALQESLELREMYEQNPQIKKLIDMASLLEGMPRHASTHAAGVVITREPLTHYLPLYKAADGPLTTQFAKDQIEELGLLKMDLLGLRTLTVIAEAVRLIAKEGKPAPDIEKIPLADPPTYALLAAGETAGVFQLESSGMRAILKDLRPEGFEDIVALVALYRPGPLGSGMVEDFVKRKHGQKKITYLHPQLEPILKDTYGVILYQEQVMRIASDLAGFSLGQADLLRRAMGKKKPEIIAGLRSQFVAGAVQNGCAEEVAGQIFDLMEYFAGYGFNKCLTGESKITLLNGTVVTIKEIFEQRQQYLENELKTLSINDELKLVPSRIIGAYKNGVKDVFKLKTRTGRTIKATSNHQFFTFSGWRQLHELSIGDRVAVPRKLPLHNQQSMPEFNSSNTTLKQLASDMGISERNLWNVNSKNKKGYRRETVQIISDYLKSQPLGKIAYSDVLWDEIVSIEPAGKEMTYDLTIEGTHNFIANDLIVHNSHSAAYALVAYQTAYLKANHPAAYMAALLTSVRDNTDKIAAYVEECRRMDIAVLPPDINESETDFTVVGGKIRFGLAAIKNVGVAAVEMIIRERQERGAFRSYTDFCRRLDTRVINRRVVESLIKSGAFDSLGHRRAQLMAAVDSALELAGQAAKERSNGQVTIFDLLGEDSGDTFSFELPELAEYPSGQLLAMEKEALGLYISGHPLAEYRGQLSRLTTAKVAEIGELEPNSPLTLGGMITAVKKINTRKGELMARCQFEDLTGACEVICFARTYQECKSLLQPDRVVIVRGRVSFNDEAAKVVAEEILPVKKVPSGNVYLQFKHTSLDLVTRVQLTLRSCPGSSPVYLYFPRDKKLALAPKEFWVDLSTPVVARLQALLGPENVKVKGEEKEAEKDAGKQPLLR